MVKSLEYRFGDISEEYKVSFEPSTHLLALAMDIGVSAGHVHVATVTELYMVPPPLSHYGQHTVEHFDLACKKEARRAALIQTAAAHCSLRNGDATETGSYSTWSGPSSPSVPFSDTSSAPSNLSTTAVQLSHEGSMHTIASCHTSDAQKSWITQHSCTTASFPDNTAKRIDTFPGRIRRRLVSNRSLADEDTGPFSQSALSCSSSQDSHRWWGSLRGWKGRK